jgi:hypothetical protein
LANDPSGTAQRNPSEDAEVWWRKYEADVHKSVVAAEEHLEVPAGTISSIPNDADFIATVKMYAVVEPQSRFGRIGRSYSAESKNTP